MNERIKLLAQQAEVLADEATNSFNDESGKWKSVWNEVYDQKFAELIVRECVRVGDRAFCSDHSVVPVFPAEKIKQHFGVEE